MNVSRGRVYSKPLGGKRKGRHLVWFLDYCVDGRRVRKATAAASKTEAQALLRAETTDIERMKRNLPPLREERLRDAAPAYIQLKKAQGRRSYRDIAISIGHVADHLGDLFISRIDATHLEDYRTKRLKEGAAMSTINREMAALKNLYHEWNRKKKYIGRNPVMDLRFYPEQGRAHFILTKDQYAALVAKADPRLRPIIQVAMHTGLRKNDILQLRWADLDEERKTLTARIAKTGKLHIIGINQTLAGILAEIPRTGEHMFTNPETHRPWNDVKKMWAKAKAAAGLGDADLVFHDLRATAGTRVADKKGTRAAQVLLGHKDQRTTEAYLHRTEEITEAAADALEDFYGTAEDEALRRHQN